jgi:hypothetical protein
MARGLPRGIEPTSLPREVLTEVLRRGKIWSWRVAHSGAKLEFTSIAVWAKRGSFRVSFHRHPRRA